MSPKEELIRLRMIKRELLSQIRGVDKVQNSDHEVIDCMLVRLYYRLGALNCEIIALELEKPMGDLSEFA